MKVITNFVLEILVVTVLIVAYLSMAVGLLDPDLPSDRRRSPPGPLWTPPRTHTGT